jgi:hypothetical protein
VVRRLIRLYPGWWRERYGEEMARLFDDLAPLSRGTRLKTTFGMLAGAADARLSPQFRERTGATRAVRLAAGAAVIGWLPLAVLTVMSNVVFSARLGGDQLAPAVYLYVLAALAVTGKIACRACGRRWSWLLAGAVAGVIMAGLFLATLAVTDSAFPALVGQQQQHITGFRSSGMSSMRDYLLASLERTIAGVTIEGAVLGAAMGFIGGASAGTGRAV